MKNLPPQQVNSWPEDRMQELLNLFNNKHWTIDRCAKHFGVTRNVVTGKITRGRAKYGFEQRQEGQNTRSKPQFKKPPKPRVYSNKKCKLPDDKNKAIVIIGPNGLTNSVINSRFVEPAWEEKTVNNCDIWKLEPHNCVWPVSGQGVDTVYCGANKTTQSYCVGHSIKSRRA